MWAMDLTDRQRRRGWVIVGAFCAMVAYLVSSHLWPSSAIIGCPFRWATGYSCFGCGMTRATAHALFGEFGASVHYHPFGILFLTGFAATAAHHAVQNVKGRPLDYAALRLWRRISGPAWVVAALVVVGFGAVRFALEVAGILTPI
jgi:hypothetical protein